MTPYGAPIGALPDAAVGRAGVEDAAVAGVNCQGFHPAVDIVRATRIPASDAVCEPKDPWELMDEITNPKFVQ